MSDPPFPAEPKHDVLDAVTILPDTQTSNGNLGLPAPEIVGNYRLIKEIARGGMGVVYLAQHCQISRQVAIKTILLDVDSEAVLTERFAREAETVARLDHPGIVTIYEVGQHENRPYIAMRYIDGGSLSALLHSGPLACERALDIALKVSEAMSHAHEHGIIHRDLKPANILIDQNREPVVTDFGIAKYVEATKSHLTTAGEPIGTPHYMPPEQADTRFGDIGPWSDVYSIGAMMYAMLTGRPPFQAATSMDVIFQMLSNDPVPPSRLNSMVPSTLEAIVLKCLQKQPRLRYQSALDLANDLKNFRDGKPTIARPIRGLRILIYQLRKHFMLATVSGSVVMLLLLTTLIVVISHVKLLNKNFSLEFEKEELAGLLSTERRLFQTRVSTILNKEIGDAELAAERLAFYASSIKDENLALAASLAIESIKQSREASLPESSEMIETLRQYLLKQDVLEKDVLKQDQINANESNVIDWTTATASDIVSAAEQILGGKLTDKQRSLYGLKPSDGDDSSEIDDQL